MSTSTKNERVQFQELREPRMPGIGKLPAGAAAFVVVAAALLILLITFQMLWLAVFWTVGVVVAVVPLAIRNRDKYSLYALWHRRRRHKAAQRRGETSTRQGLTGHVPDGRCRLPGAGAVTEVSAQHDMHQRPYGLISWPQTNLHSVVIQTFPAGFEGLDQWVRDSQVAFWGGWLAQLNQIGSIVGAAVTVETAPDSGQRLRRAMKRGVVEDAPEFSEQVAEELLMSTGTSSPTVSVWVTLTFSGKAAADDAAEDALSVEEMAEVISDVLPTLTGTLDMTGAGTGSRPCPAQEIVDHTRVAYDPGVAPLVEEAVFSGKGTGLTWQDVGPISAENGFDVFEHEGALSRTWQMRQPPRGAFFDQTLKSLLEPHRDVARKRVTLLFRPETPENSATAAENDVTKAMLQESKRKRARAADSLAVQRARKTAEQEASGAPLVRVGMVVTVTVLERAALAKATRAVVKNLAPQARLALRVPKASQDVAFLAGLPLGMVVPEHLRVPASVREAM